MEPIFRYVKSIVYFILLMKLIQCLVPSGHIHKVFKLVTGILLILIILKPLLSLTDTNEKLVYEFIRSEYQIQVGSLEDDFAEGSNLNQEISDKIYIEKITEQISAIVRNEGGELINIQIDYNNKPGDPHYGLINGLQMDISLSANSINESISVNEASVLMEKNLKSILKDFYNISADNMNINIVAN